MVVHNLWSYVNLKYQFMAHTADYGASAILPICENYLKSNRVQKTKLYCVQGNKYQIFHLCKYILNKNLPHNTFSWQYCQSQKYILNLDTIVFDR